MEVYDEEKKEIQKMVKRNIANVVDAFLFYGTADSRNVSPLACGWVLKGKT